MVIPHHCGRNRCEDLADRRFTPACYVELLIEFDDIAGEFATLTRINLVLRELLGRPPTE